MRIIFLLAALFFLKVPPLPARISGNDTVMVSGAVAQPLKIAGGNSGGLSLKAGSAHDVRSSKGELKKRVPAFSGYLLREILEAAHPEMPDHKDQGKYIVVVTATDGYTVVFSYNELFLSPAASATWVIPVSNLESLAADGPFVVLCASDRPSASRYVKWVKSIELRKI